MDESRFRMEEMILELWGLDKDLQLVITAISETDLSKDQLLNLLIGLKELHALRSDQLFCLFERKIADGTLV